MINSVPAWRAIGAHLQTSVWPEVTNRVTLHQRPFVEHLLAALHTELIDFNPVATGLALSPFDLQAELDPMRPDDAIIWSPGIGERLGQMIHVGAAESLRRLLPLFVRAVDARSKEAATAEIEIGLKELALAHPMDRFVARAITAHVASGSKLQVAEVVPDGSRQVPKQQAPRLVALRWVGTPDRWNVVQAINFLDAAPHEVARSMFKQLANDFHGEDTAFLASELTAIPPYYVVKPALARRFQGARAAAPMLPPGTVDEEPRIDAMTSRLALGRGSDAMALREASQESAASPPSAPPAAAPTVDELRTTFDEVLIQLGFLRGLFARWGLVEGVVAASLDVDRRRGEVLKSPADQRAQWAPILTGQRDRLFRIVTSMTTLTSGSSLGAARDASHPLRPILTQLAAAVASSHLATTCEARIAEAERMQASLSLRSLQANMVDLEMARDQAHPGGRDGDKITSDAGSATERVRSEARQIENRMIAGLDVDAAEVERVQIEAQEQSLRYRIHGLRVQIGALQMHAAAAGKGFSARIAGLFSGKFRDLPGVAGFLVAALGGVEIELDAHYAAQAAKPRSGDAAGLTPLSPATEAKKFAVARGQARFAKLAEDHDLRHFLSEGAAIVEAQQFRTACVQAAVMIGINFASSALGGWVGKVLGERFLAANALEKVAELTTGAQRVISVATMGTEIAANTLGQYATTDSSLLESFVENSLLTLGTAHTLGKISREVEQARAFQRMLDKEVKAITAVETRVASQAAKLGKVARWSAAQTIEISAHAVVGMAMGSVVHKLEESVGLVNAQQQTSSGKMEELLIQGASIALAKLMHAKLGERLPSLARLAQQRESAHAQKLYNDALQLLALSHAVASSQHPEAARSLELLDRQRQLLEDEITTIDDLIARHGTTHPEHVDLAAGRVQLEAQLGRVNDAGMLDLRFQFVGLHSLGGPVWTGNAEQIAHAKQQIAIVDPSSKLIEDPATGVVRATVGGHEIELHEVQGYGRPPIEVPAPKKSLAAPRPKPSAKSPATEPAKDAEPYATTSTPLSDHQRNVVDGTTPRGKGAPAAQPRLDEFESHSFQTPEQEDASRWQDHGIDSFADEAVRDPEHASKAEQAALAFRNDPEMRLWYGKWKSMPDRVLRAPDGSYQPRLPPGVPEHVATKLSQILPKTNVLLVTQGMAIREQIVREMPGAVLDPADPQWGATRKRLVDMFGEARVAKFEQERSSRKGDASREDIDKRIDQVVDERSIAELRAMFPGAEVYITGATSQPSKLNERTADVDLVVVLPENTPQHVRVEIEGRLNQLHLRQPPSKDRLNAAPRAPLPIDSKVMTPSEFAGLALVETPKGRTPLNYARVDTTPPGPMPGVGVSGGDLHTHMLGVTPASYFIEKIGGGKPAVALEKAWEAVQSPRLRKPNERAKLPVTPGVARQLLEALTDVRRSRSAGMPEPVVDARAQRALDDALEASARTAYDETYDLRDLLIQAYIDPNGAWENFATDVITTESARGVTRSEQSVSLGKLKTRFTEAAMKNAHARAGGNDTDLKFLVMSPTNKTLSSERPESVQQALREQLMRDDVKGIDIAGPERQRFTAAGLAWFSEQIEIARSVAHEKGSAIVVRPHVGEGYKTGDTTEHVTIARENIELMLGTLEKARLGDGVIVRLGHATHATPEQLARMAKMGIIVEANVGSNLATGIIATADSHPLLLNMYYGVSTVLSTDGAGVMRTNLSVEYLRAATMIEQFKSGQLTLATKEGNVKYQDLKDPAQKARFSVAWLTEQLAGYYAVADAPVKKGQ